MNDHSPVFLEKTKILEISESTPVGSRFTLEGAYDPDYGVNSLKSYELSDNINFLLQVKEGSNKDKIPVLVLQKAFDREMKAKYEYTLTAIDGGNPPRSGNMNIIVMIADINDNVPIFDREIYSVILEENCSIGSLVLKMNASDLDEGSNGEIIYSFDSSVKNKVDDVFELDIYSGEITENLYSLKTISKLDRESVSQYNITILAKDFGSPSLSSHKNVFVTLIDVNDNPPKFLQDPYVFYIEENNIPGASILAVSAVDADANENAIVTYHLREKETVDKPMVPFLSIMSDSGQVFSFTTFDAEEVKYFTFTVVAKDSGVLSLSCNVTVTVFILDQNDNPPIFVFPVAENCSIGSLVLKLNASDLDEGSNREIIYSFDGAVKNNVEGLFELDIYSGEITVKGLIDFEEKTFYEFQVKATDRGPVPMSSECSVLIEIKDMNDNAPFIEVTSLTSSISEDVKPGTTIGLISITDLDSGVNSKISCTLSHNLPFELATSFQENLYSLKTISKLDRETVNQYNITLLAKDFGNPSLSSQKTVFVNLLDVNDNHPRFMQDPYVFYIVENNIPGASILAVSAVDADVDENAIVTYHLREKDTVEKPMVPFLSIMSDSGQVFSFTTFDAEELKSFTFTVVAKDSGVPSLSCSVTVTVFILDQNDNPPIFVFPVTTNGTAVVEETIPRNVKAGYLVTRIRAYDADVGYNAWLSFYLEEATDLSLFSVGRYTGEIRTRRAMVESDAIVHKMIILAKDSGSISLSASATVIITAAENTEAHALSEIKSITKKEEGNKNTFYLIIVLSSVSSLFIITILTLIALQCHRARGHFLRNKYLENVNYAEVSGSLFHSHNYQAAEKRFVFVGSEGSRNSVMEVGSNGNTLPPPGSRRL
uniref:Cadherin domain-containing protein n=1 Tax=Erpetoichthys calabaricus TaxID=27687 RepID=A0A8C4SHV9_ERPCA